MTHILWLFYSWPNGLVWSNILAEPIILILTVIGAWVFRDWLMARWVAFHHKHKELHLAKLAGTPRSSENDHPRNPAG